MSSFIRYRLTTVAPMPDPFAEQVLRFTHSKAWADTRQPEHTHGVVHVLTTAPLADEAAAFFLDALGVPYEVHEEADR
jgi:hypothetical protein